MGDYGQVRKTRLPSFHIPPRRYQIRVALLEDTVGIGFAVFLETESAPLLGQSTDMLNPDRRLNPAVLRDRRRNRHQMQPPGWEDLALLIAEQASVPAHLTRIVIIIRDHAIQPEQVRAVSPR